jgi:hypothetical protein
MNDTSPFDHQPDAELGALLREALTAPDRAGFAQRVMARLPAALARQSGWDILNTWARPGLVAAAVMLFLAGGWLGRMTAEPEAPADLVLGETFTGTMLASQDEPDLDVELVLLGDQ